MKKFFCLGLIFMILIGTGIRAADIGVCINEEIETYQTHFLVGSYFLTIIGSGPTKEVAYRQAVAMREFVQKELALQDLERLIKNGPLEICFLCTEPQHGEAMLLVTKGQK